VVDSLDVNNKYKRPISLQNIYIWLVKPICFTTPFGVATRSLRSPARGFGNLRSSTAYNQGRLTLLF